MLPRLGRGRAASFERGCLTLSRGSQAGVGAWAVGHGAICHALIVYSESAVNPSVSALSWLHIPTQLNIKVVYRGS